MSETKWTPGPWICESNLNSYGREIFAVGPSGKSGYVSLVEGSDKDHLPHDANLIAQAPSLYEALDMAYSFIVGAGYHGKIPTAQQVHETCEAVLAKCRGEK